MNIVLHQRRLMNNGVIKMFLAAWRNANDISVRKEKKKKGGLGLQE